MQQVRASSLARTMACAGSLFFTDLPEKEDKEAAREGTAAGEMLEYKLTMRPYGTNAKNGVAFDQDMEFYTTPIAQSIFENAASPILCETDVSWTTRSGITIGAHYDAAYIGRDGNLWIEDLKYGWGLVEVKNNWQLLAYAIGEVLRRKQYFLFICVVIRQPRPHHEDGDRRVWKIPYEELLMYKEQIEKRMDQIAEGDRTLSTSPQCKYCPAAAKCPALSKAFHFAIEVSQRFMQDEISENEISFQLDLVTRAKQIIEIKLDSLMTLAQDRVKKGKVIPNYVLEASYGHREWKKTVSPKTIKAMTGKDIIAQTMLTPAKAEKLGVPKEVIAAMTKQEFKGQKLKKTDTQALGERIFGKRE